MVYSRLVMLGGRPPQRQLRAVHEISGLSCWRGTVNGFGERIERIQTKFKRQESCLKGDHPFNPLQKSADSIPFSYR